MHYDNDSERSIAWINFRHSKANGDNFVGYKYIRDERRYLVNFVVDIEYSYFFARKVVWLKPDQPDQWIRPPDKQKPGRKSLREEGVYTFKSEPLTANMT